LGLGWRSARIGATVFGHVETDALKLLGRIEIAGPLPNGDGAVDAVVLGRNPHLLAATERDRAHISVLEALLLEKRATGVVDLLDAVGNLETKDTCRFMQAFGVFGQLEDFAAIGALAFKHTA